MVLIGRVEKYYLGILDLQCAATGVDVRTIERCLGTLSTLHGVKCKSIVKEKTEHGNNYIDYKPECSKYEQHFTMTWSAY